MDVCAQVIQSFFRNCPHCETHKVVRTDESIDCVDVTVVTCNDRCILKLVKKDKNVRLEK